MKMARYERLRRSYLLRAAWFNEHIEHQRVLEETRNAGVANALTLLQEALRSSHEESAFHSEPAHLAIPDLAESVEDSLTAELNLLRERIQSHDAHFARQSKGLSPAVQYMLKNRCAELDVAPRALFVTVGEPDNFACSEPTFDHVTAHLDASHGKAARMLSITVPRIEGEHALWLPVPVGHELAHYFLKHLSPRSLRETERAIERSKTIARVHLPDDALERRPVSVPDPKYPSVGGKLNAQRLVNDWLHELICDAYTVRIFGVAGYAALAEFLESVGNKESTGTNYTHPPSYFRCRLMRECVSLGASTPTPEEQSLLDRFADLETADPSAATQLAWAQPILDFLERRIAKIWAATAEWTDGTDYWTNGFSANVPNLVASIGDGIPPIEANPNGQPATAPEIVNAAWLALHDENVRAKWATLKDEEFGSTVDRLALKAIEDAHFLGSWATASENPVVREQLTPEVLSRDPGVLASSELKARLAAIDGDRIVLTPRLPGAIGRSSVDLRLGSSFIVFDRASHPAFDALADNRPNPRTMQHRVSRKWGEPFYLHPNQLVLASALEYLVMPGDLSAQVVTRSSYGRLGLITATAVQVHPGYRGCLTLELVNLGEVPIAIVPGQRIAQLMFFNTSGTYPPADVSKYDCPVGPEFSKVTEDKEADVLQILRNRS